MEARPGVFGIGMLTKSRLWEREKERRKKCGRGHCPQRNLSQMNLPAQDLSAGCFHSKAPTCISRALTCISIVVYPYIDLREHPEHSLGNIHSGISVSIHMHIQSTHLHIHSTHLHISIVVYSFWLAQTVCFGWLTLCFGWL